MSKPRVFITGGTGSVGRSLIAKFTQAKYNVTFQYFSNESLAKQLAHQYQAEGIRIDFLNSFELLGANYDVLVNNAGVNITDQSPHLVTQEDWDTTMWVNLSVPFLLTKACLPYMLSRKSGCIVNISSIYALRAVEGNLPYTVSKHGLTGFTKTIAKEYAHYGIRCNEVCPGPIESDMMNRIADREASVTHHTAEEYLSEVKESIPLGRMASPDDVAEAALFLASPQAQYITGISLTVDGGMIIT